MCLVPLPSSPLPGSPRRQPETPADKASDLARRLEEYADNPRNVDKLKAVVVEWQQFVKEHSDLFNPHWMASACHIVEDLLETARLAPKVAAMDELEAHELQADDEDYSDEEHIQFQEVAGAARLVARMLDECGNHAIEEDGSSEFSLDESTLSVTYQGKQCRLRTELQFRFLQRLHEARGTYVSYEKLLSDVWKNSTPRGVDEAIQQMASKVRKQLKDAGMQPVADAIYPPSPRLYAFDLSRNQR